MRTLPLPAFCPRTILPDPADWRFKALLLPVEIVVPVSCKLFDPKSSVPTLPIFLVAAEIFPVKVNAPICSVPVEEMEFVPLEKEIPALVP